MEIIEFVFNCDAFWWLMKFFALMADILLLPFVSLFNFIKSKNIPKYIESTEFEENLLKKIKRKNEKNIILQCYQSDNKSNIYLIEKNISKDQKKNVRKILQSLEFQYYDRFGLFHKLERLEQKIETKISGKNINRNKKAERITKPLYTHERKVNPDEIKRKDFE